MNGKTVLLTGSNRGIGGALRTLLEQSGYKVFAYSRAELGDLRERTTISRLKEVAVASDIDILINCAGVYSDKIFLNDSDDKIEEIIQVNLLAPILLTKAVWSVLAKNRGMVVNINSMAGRLPLGHNEFVYRVSKYGLTAFSAFLASLAVGVNVRVLDLPLSAVATDMTKKRPPNEKYPDPSPQEAAAVILSVMESNYFNRPEHPLIVGHVIDNGVMLPEGGKN